MDKDLVGIWDAVMEAFTHFRFLIRSSSMSTTWDYLLAGLWLITAVVLTSRVVRFMRKEV